MKMQEPEFKDTKNNLGQKLYIFKALETKVPVKMLSISLIQDEGIEQKTKEAGQSAKVIYDNTKKLVDENSKKMNINITPVSGLGDDAFLSGKILYITKGNVYLMITLTNISIEEAAASKAFAAAFTCGNPPSITKRFGRYGRFSSCSLKRRETTWAIDAVSSRGSSIINCR